MHNLSKAHKIVMTKSNTLSVYKQTQINYRIHMHNISNSQIMEACFSCKLKLK